MRKKIKVNPKWLVNIRQAFDKASPEEVTSGVRWYQDARTWAARVANDQGLDLSTVAGVLAALSPMVNWNQNKLDCLALIKGRDHVGKVTVTTYNANKRKAIKILRGANPLENLGKFKTLDFYNAILGAESACCIDRHASAVAYGRVLTEAERKQVRRNLYRSLQLAYKTVATELGYKAYEVQAVTWVYWRNLPSWVKE